MSATSFGGLGLSTFPHHRMKLTSGQPAFGSSVIDATGEKVAWCGRVWRPDGAGGDISRVGFLFGTVTKAGGSGLTLSLQDTSLTAGAPAQPDGTQDQTVAIANGDASFATDTWYRTGALSANRAVSYGDLLSVVLEFDGSGRQGADSVNVKNIDLNDTVPILEPSVSLFTSSWANVAHNTNIVLEFSDGVFGTLYGTIPWSDISSFSFGSSSSPDEYALRFTPAVPCTTNGVELLLANNGGAFSVVLYQGTTALQTVTVDTDTLAYEGSVRRSMFVPLPFTDLSAGTAYYFSVLPTTTTALTLAYFDVNDANHWGCHQMGTAAYLGQRTDAGSWTDTTTRRPAIFPRFCKFDSGGGGGLLTHPGMSGGMRG